VTHIWSHQWGLALSLNQDKFPSKFKISRTIPIFKADHPKIYDNYRPISSLSFLAKTLEKRVSIQLTNHLEFSKLLYEYQYGFERGNSKEFYRT
jgi:hypothetical protein